MADTNQDVSQIESLVCFLLFSQFSFSAFTENNKVRTWVQHFFRGKKYKLQAFITNKTSKY